MRVLIFGAGAIYGHVLSEAGADVINFLSATGPRAASAAGAAAAAS